MCLLVMAILMALLMAIVYRYKLCSDMACSFVQRDSQLKLCLQGP
jgi:hypothetical protein